MDVWINYGYTGMYPRGRGMFDREKIKGKTDMRKK